MLSPAFIIGRGKLRCCRLSGSGSQDAPSTSAILWLLICMVMGHWLAARICRASRWLRFARLRPFLWGKQTETQVAMLASNFQAKQMAIWQQFSIDITNVPLLFAVFYLAKQKPFRTTWCEKVIQPTQLWADGEPSSPLQGSADIWKLKQLRLSIASSFLSPGKVKANPGAELHLHPNTVWWDISVCS